MRNQLELIKLQLENVSKMGTIQQMQQIWPLVWKLWALMAVMVEEMEKIKHGR